MSLMGEYEYVINKNHPRANKEGQVYLHIIVAERKIGRLLFPEEVVHHKDGNKLNNEENNLMVFATKGDHTSFHLQNCNEELLSLNKDGSYICKPLKRNCVDCGAEITKGAIRCKTCSYVFSRKINRPSAEELYRMITELNGNFSQLSKRFGVTDNAIRKWCRKYNIPSCSSFYNNKIMKYNLK